MYRTFRIICLLLKIAEKDVLDDRLIGWTFGDNSETEHMLPRGWMVRSSSEDRRCSRA